MACVYYLNGSGPLTELELDDALLREEQIKNNDIVYSKEEDKGENFGRAHNYNAKRTWQQRFNSQKIKAANDEAFKHVIEQKDKDKLLMEELGFDDPIEVNNKRDYISVTDLMRGMMNIVSGKPNNPVFPLVDMDKYWDRITPLLSELTKHIDEEIDVGNGHKKVFFPQSFVNLMFGVDQDGKQVKPRDIQQSEIPYFRQRMEYIWAQQAVIGTEIHNVLSIYFQHYFGSRKNIQQIYDDILASDEWKNKFNNNAHKDHFNYINQQINGEYKLLTDAIATAKEIEKQIADKYKSSNPIVFTEVNVIGDGLVNSHEVGVLGRLDLLVMDDKGNVEVIDFKCSPKEYNNYDPAKTRTFRYQLGIYRKLLQQLNLQSEKRQYQLTVIPIVFGNFAFHNDDHTVSYSSIGLGTQSPSALIDIEKDTNIISEVVEGNIDIVLKDSKIEDLTNEGILEYVNNFMSKAFPQWHKYMNSTDDELKQLVKEYMDRNCTIEQKEEKEGVILFDKKRKRTIEGKNEAELLNIIMQEWKAARSRNSQIASDVQSALIDGQRGNGFVWKREGKLKNEDYSQKEWVEKVVGKYATPEWRVISKQDFLLPGQDPRTAKNSVLDLLNKYGIILLENRNTHLIEVLKCTNRELNAYELLGGARHSKYILGTFLDDDVQRRDPNSLILESVQGNVQLMETMAVLNCLSSFLTKQNRAIGQIMVINPEGFNYTGGLTASNKQLLYNFNRLCKLVGTDNNYLVDDHTQGIKMLNYSYLVQEQLLSIIEQARNNKLNKGLSPFIDKATNFASKFDDFIGNKEELLLKLQKLKEDMENAIPTLKGNVSKQLIDFADSQDILIYNNILQAISQVSGFDIVQQLNAVSKSGGVQENSKYFNSSGIVDLLLEGVNGSYTDNPGTLQSANLNKMASTTERGYQNVRIAVVKFNDELQKALRKLKAKKGFSSMSKYTIGNQASLFSNMYDNDAKKFGKLQFKNPFDPNSLLSPEEREFLQFAIRKLANDRWNLTDSEGNFQEEMFQQRLNADPDDVLAAPLIRADFASIVANSGGILQAIKNYFKQFTPQNIKERAYELLDKKDENNNSIKTRAKNGDIYEMINRIDNSYDKELREKLLIKYDKEGKPQYQVNLFETNLEKILLSSNMAKNLQKEMNKIFPIMKSIVMGLAMQGFTQNDQFINDINYAQDYIKNKILGLPLEDLEQWSTIRTVVTQLGSAASKLALAFNPIQLYQTIDGIWKDIMLCIQKPDMNPDGISAFSKENMTDSFFWIIKDIWHFGDKPSLGEAINRLYGLNDMDINQFSKQLSTDNAGIFNFWSLGFRFTTRPDFYNRLTIFGAQMRQLGCWEAHSLTEDGELVYDWKKDKRFSRYAKGDKSDIYEYNKQKSLYLTMAREFIDEGAMDVTGKQLFKLGTDENPTALPRAFTTKQSESLKALGDKIYGYYAHEKKSMIQSYTLGAMFMQMHTYWSSKKNQYISGHGFTQQGEFRQYSEIQTDENGNQVEVKYWMDENGMPTATNTGVPYLVWKGRPQEGILVTLSNLVRDSIFGLKDENGDILTDEKGRKMIGFSYMYKRYLTDDSNIDPYIRNLYRANMKQLFYDLFMLFFVGMFVGRSLMNATRKHIKEVGNDELSTAFMNTCLFGMTKMIASSADDFNFLRSICGQFVDWTPFSLGMMTRQVNNMWNILADDNDAYDGIVNIASATRNTKPIWDYVKINTIGRRIGEKPTEE